MARPKTKPHEPARKAGRLELSIHGAEYATLVASGVCAAIPVATWVAMLLSPFGSDRPFGLGAPWNTVAAVLFVAIALLLMLVAPWLLPILVLQARQPRGARIEWSDDGVTEWDGPWKRASIAWSELQARHFTWVTKTRGGSITDEALQLVGPPDAAVITVWSSPPSGVPAQRRRLCSKDVAALREALEGHGIALSGPPDWLLAGDPDRPPHAALSIPGRFGYPLAVFAPLLVPISHVVGVGLGAASALLLGARAVPVFRELRAIRARRRGPEPIGAPRADEAGPYRAAVEASPESHASEDDGRLAADRLKLRAVTIEAVVRAGCVAMVVASTTIAFWVLH